MSRRIAALVALVLLVLPLAPAGAQAPAMGATTLTLVDRTPWVGDGLDFVLSVRIADAPADAVLRLTVYDRVTSRSAFTRSVQGLGLRSPQYRPDDTPLAEVAQSAGVITIAVPLVAQPGIGPADRIDEPGVYPVVLEVRGPDGETLAVLRTHLVRLPGFDPDDDAVPLDVAVVVPVDAAPVHLGLDAPAAPDAPLAELAAELAEHPDVRVTLVPTPETIAAAAEADPATVDAFAAAAAGSQVVGSPWVALDEAGWAATDEAQLRQQLQLGRATLAGAMGTEIDGTRVLPVGATAALADTVATHDASAVVVAESDLAPLEVGDFPFTLTRPFTLAVDGGGLPALVADGALAALSGVAATDPVLAASLVLADLAVLAGDQPGFRRVATLVLPPDAARSPAFLDALLDGLEPPDAPPAPAPSLDPAVPTPEAIPAAAPLLVASTVADAVADVEPAGAEGEPDPDDPLVRTMADTTPARGVADLDRRLDELGTALDSYEGTFGDDDAISQRLRQVVDTAASTRLDTTTRDDALDAGLAAIDGQLGGIVVPQPSTVRLTAREGQVQVVLTNATGRPAQVTLVLRGDRLVLPDAPDRRLTVTLAEGTTRVDVRVEARSSGDAPLDVVVVTPDERVELGRTRVTVRATAVSGVGVVLLGASAAFLVVWWTRTIVRERRSAKGRHPAHAHARR